MPFGCSKQVYLSAVTMSIQSDSPNKPMSPLSEVVQSIFSDNSNIMLAAIISLLLVILFVLLLHVYAKWFLAQAQAQAQARRRHHRRRRNSVMVSDVLGPTRFHHFHNFNFEDSSISRSSTKGLDSAIIAAIPLFLYEAEKMKSDGKNNEDNELECVICLSAFDNSELGRSLPKCDHAFHVECIDMWLNSHSNCPVCRAPIVAGIVESDSSQLSSSNGDDSNSGVVEIVVNSPSSEINLNENESESGNENGGVSDFVSETSSSLLACSLKRMLSKVLTPSNNVNESEA